MGVQLYAAKIEEPLLKTIEENMYLERDDHADESEEGKKTQGETAGGRSCATSEAGDVEG
jgi:hypothetical protein